MFRTSIVNIKFNKKHLFLGLLICLGTVIGAIVVCFSEKAFIENLSFLVNSFLKNRSHQSAASTLSNAFFSTFFILLVYFLNGFSAISQPLSFCLLIFRGLGFGICSGYLYLYYGFKGAIYSTILILPPFILSSVCLIYATVLSVKMSNCFFGLINKRAALEMKEGTLKNYFISFFIIGVLLFVVSLLECGLTLAFSRFFKF